MLPADLLEEMNGLATKISSEAAALGSSASKKSPSTPLFLFTQKRQAEQYSLNKEVVISARRKMVSEPPCLNQLYQQGSPRIGAFVPIHTKQQPEHAVLLTQEVGMWDKKKNAFRVAAPGSTTPARESPQ